MSKGIISVVIALIVVGGGAIIFLSNNNKNKTTSTTKSTSSNTTSNDSTTATIPGTSADNNKKIAVSITYSDDGFSPSSITVKSGDRVEIKNSSSSDLEFESDPHPVHTDDKDLNVGIVDPGETMTFTVTKKGSFGYHNHLNSGDTGKITVE